MMANKHIEKVDDVGCQRKYKLKQIQDSIMCQSDYQKKEEILAPKYKPMSLRMLRNQNSHTLLTGILIGKTTLESNLMVIIKLSRRYV